MKKIIVASKNPVKIQAARLGFEKMFPAEVFEALGIAVASGVADQPMTNAETLQGAINRTQNAQKVHAIADFWIGIEGGIEEVDGEMEAFAWVFILSKNQKGKAKSASFALPKAVTQLIKQGMELGAADDIVFGDSNSKQKNGAVGLLTGDVLTRAGLYEEAVKLALIPFKNQNLY